MQVTKCCKRKTFDHDLHSQVRHVPTTVFDDVVQQHLQVCIYWIHAAHFFVEVTCEHFNVTSLVYYLCACIQLCVVPRDSFHNFGCADERTLFAVQKLRQRPSATFDTKLKPFFVIPFCEWSICVKRRINTTTDEYLVGSNRFLDVN